MEFGSGVDPLDANPPELDDHESVGDVDTAPTPEPELEREAPAQTSATTPQLTQQRRIRPFQRPLTLDERTATTRPAHRHRPLVTRQRRILSLQRPQLTRLMRASPPKPDPSLRTPTAQRPRGIPTTRAQTQTRSRVRRPRNQQSFRLRPLESPHRPTPRLQQQIRPFSSDSTHSRRPSSNRTNYSSNNNRQSSS